MSYRRERVWKDMLESDTNFLNVLVILVALGGQQRSWDFIFFKENEKVINKKVYVYLCAIYARIYFNKIPKNRNQRINSNSSNAFMVNIVLS